MGVDDWFKTFGTGTVVEYYKVLAIQDEETVELEVYPFYTAVQKVGRISRRTVGYTEWLEDIVNNNVHGIPKSEVPFLFTF
jgi:hypothetical protein